MIALVAAPGDDVFAPFGIAAETGTDTRLGTAGSAPAMPLSAPTAAPIIGVRSHGSRGRRRRDLPRDAVDRVVYIGVHRDHLSVDDTPGGRER
jgi:hypothetical protein